MTAKLKRTIRVITAIFSLTVGAAVGWYAGAYLGRPRGEAVITTPIAAPTSAPFVTTTQPAGRLIIQFEFIADEDPPAQSVAEEVKQIEAECREQP